MFTMEYNTMKATVLGVTRDGTEFTDVLKFKMLPPSEGERYYGNGYHMAVETPSETRLIDVRYERTSDVEILADGWIQKHYGTSALDVIKEFCLDV